MRFLIFGDVVGRPGREAITKALPALREEYKPDSVIVNVENIAHGAGISPSTMAEAAAWKADVFTTGDHAWDNEAGVSLLDDPRWPIVRPANYPPKLSGRGYHIYTNGAWRIAVIELQGQVFFKNHPLNPFLYLDELLNKADIKEANIVLVELHVEASSEIRALGWYADGRISALWGTHTHIPAADEQILPKGTAYVSSVGMNGNYHSVIGVDVEGPLRTFTKQIPTRFTFDATGPYEIGALIIDVDPSTGRATHIANVRKILNAGER